MRTLNDSTKWRFSHDRLPSLSNRLDLTSFSVVRGDVNKVRLVRATKKKKNQPVNNRFQHPLQDDYRIYHSVISLALFHSLLQSELSAVHSAHRSFLSCSPPYLPHPKVHIWAKDPCDVMWANDAWTNWDWQKSCSLVLAGNTLMLHGRICMHI